MSNVVQDILIAVDGGGTGCRAAVGSVAAGILGRAEGGRANIGNDPAHGDIVDPERLAQPIQLVALGVERGQAQRALDPETPARALLVLGVRLRIQPRLISRHHHI